MNDVQKNAIREADNYLKAAGLPTYSALTTSHPAPGVPGANVLVPLQVLKDASEAIGHFVSDHGWGDSDMQAMDNLDAYIAQHAAQANRWW